MEDSSTGLQADRSKSLRTASIVSQFPTLLPQLMNAPGGETGPGPQLVTWGKSTFLSVDAHGFKFEYTLNSAKHIPFDWVGPDRYEASRGG
jgi:hypothetical protein